MLPVNATVEASESFIRGVRAAQAFLHETDERGAARRYAALLDRIKTARATLQSNPEIGRPVDLQGLVAQRGALAAARAVAIGVAQGAPNLRKLVVSPYVLLYAHGNKLVMLLSFKHERELQFSF